MNQSKTIEIEIEYTFSDFLRNIFWQTFKKTWIFLLLITIAIYLWIFIVSSQKSVPPISHPPEISFMTLLPFFIPLFILMFMLLNIYLASRKSFKSVKRKIHYSFSEDGYEVFAPVGKSEMGWESLEAIEEKAADFLLFPRRPMFVIIPKRCFESETQIAEFRELVRSQLGAKAKLKSPPQRLGLK